MQACQSLNLQNVTLEQTRNSGLDIDQVMILNTLSECQWRTNQHVQRCFRANVGQVALPRNLRTICRGSRHWNQPKLCLLRRLRRRRRMCLCAHDDVVASRIRAYGVLCRSICKDQTNVVLRRAYLVNLRRDIKDRWSHYRRSVNSAMRHGDILSNSMLCHLVLPSWTVARGSETMFYCIVEQQRYLVWSQCLAGHTAEHLGHDCRFVCVG